ncbi:DNA polymerase epsilon subunit 2 [Anoplophora glabripennis]|uniref:DNA polymerase epsilon subunit 2 n=1 Tax=Anoplophora glabripennis TaxID=217634 RepID=UPI00087442DA|nr:DNA polymerase epsilon subunit 2 [Anoplophora glabripennis]
MSSSEKLKNKLHSALKLSGFSVRREFCALIIDKCSREGVELDKDSTFNNIVKDICNSLETQCLSDRSIEREHIDRAIEVCLHSGYDRHETVFNVINAFDFPKLKYNPDRKMYFIDNAKSKMLASADVKAKMFLERYSTILQRTKRNFLHKISDSGRDQLKLQTVDYLLTLSYVTLDRTLILGSILQVTEGKYYLEDPTGIVQLDLTHAKYHGGFFVENIFVLVNGYYEDKILHVSTIVLPPGEEYKDSRHSFGNINYFGGLSSVPLKDSQRLKEHLIRNKSEMIMFFSDVWFDHPLIFEKLEYLFEGIQASPPIAFVFMGNFMSESHGSEVMDTLKKLFKKLAEMISKFPNIVNVSQFVFVPGLIDPCTPHLVPRLPLPKYVTSDFSKMVPKSIFATNPCRLQYCTKEIVLFRADIVPKLLQATLYKPAKDEIADCVVRTVINQGHLSPLSLNSLTVHWDFDYCLRLYPLPDLIVIGDKSEAYQGKHKGCHVVNPGSFCESGFQFKSYTPFTDSLDDCEL